MRLYLFKRPIYRYEQEIRFVFGIDPDLLQKNRTNGILINLNGKELVQEISTSPEIPSDEAELVQQWFKQVKDGSVRSPDYPSIQSAGGPSRVKLAKSNPFTNADEPGGVFLDLDF